VNINDYLLHVESLDSEVVAFAPMLASHHPRVIAIGEGHGELLRISMFLPESCRARKPLNAFKYVKSNNAVLASSLAPVEVVFKNIDASNKQENIQNDGVLYKDSKFRRNPADLSDITDLAGMFPKIFYHH